MNPSLDSRHRPHFARLVASLLLSCGILSTPSLAQGTPSPQLIPFQGRLTNQAGVAYANGQYTITLNLYSLAIGGSTVWTERHEKVSVIGGMLNMFLGSIAPFDKGTASLTDDVDFSTTKYLGITVDADNNPATADPEMVPRTMLVPAFHAQNATQLAGYDWTAILQSGSNNPQTGTIRGDKLTTSSVTSAQLASGAVITDRISDGAVTSAKLADNSISAADLASVVREALIPPGTILPYGGATAPAGFLNCDGTSYPKATYPNLAAVLNNGPSGPNGSAFGGSTSNFDVPDLRGRFLRGTDSGSGRDPNAGSRTAMKSGGNLGNSIGSIQDDSVRQHSHPITDPGHVHNIRTRNTYENATNDSGAGSSQLLEDEVNNVTTGTTNRPNALKAPSNITQTDLSVGSETRPINAYVSYIIKY